MSSGTKGDENKALEMIAAMDTLNLGKRKLNVAVEVSIAAEILTDGAHAPFATLEHRHILCVDLEGKTPKDGMQTILSLDHGSLDHGSPRARLDHGSIDHGSIGHEKLGVREIVSLDMHEFKSVTDPIVQKLVNDFSNKLRSDGDVEEGDTIRSVNVVCKPIDTQNRQIKPGFSKHLYILTK